MQLWSNTHPVFEPESKEDSDPDKGPVYTDISTDS